jgi:ectoine hydroxylase-related dioxygenase (phytanoyl-CoA dioxygenase family)
VIALVFFAVGDTFTHLRLLPDLVHLNFTLFVVCVAPTLEHLPPEVAASTGNAVMRAAPIAKIATRRIWRPISDTIIPMNNHPWNKSFEWQNHTATSGVLSQAQIDQFDRDGYVVVNDIFSADELRDLVAITDSADAEAVAVLAAQPNERIAISEKGAITFAGQLASKIPEIRRFVKNPTIMAACRDLVGSDVRMYHDQTVYKQIEKPRRFPWHQDNGYLFVEPQHYLTCWISLNGATIENGCPQVVTGLHKQGTMAHYIVPTLGFECFETPPSTPAIAEVKAGGAVFFSSLTPHLTGPNTSNGVRKAYIVQYAKSDAVVLEGNANDGNPTGSHPITTEPRGLPVLQDGVICTD